MKNTSLRLILLIIIQLLGSCKEKENKLKSSSNREKFYIVDFSKNINNKNKLFLSSFADSITYVPLETDPKFLISEIKDLRVNNSYIFIHTKSKELLVFLRSGKFYSRIGNMGRGPKEYYDIIHFAANDDFVYILDYSKRIAKYKITGEFVKYIALSKQASRILLQDNNNIACYIPDSQFEKFEFPYSILFVNQKGDSIKSIKSKILRDPSGKISNHYALTNFSNEHLNTIKEAFNDTLFYFDEFSNKMHGFAFMDLGVHKMDYTKPFEQIIQAPHNMRISKLVDINSHLFIYYACNCKGNKTIHLLAYDKNIGQCFTLNDQNLEEKLINDISNEPNFKPDQINSNNELIGHVDAWECLKYNDFVRKYNIKNSDNPIIVIVKLCNY